MRPQSNRLNWLCLPFEPLSGTLTSVLFWQSQRQGKWTGKESLVMTSQTLDPVVGLDDWIESPQDVNIGVLVRGFEKVGITDFATKGVATRKMKALRLATRWTPWSRCFTN
jgi:hypothetical protein